MLCIIKSMNQKFVVIIPCFNESKTILKVVQDIYELELDLKIFLIDDGSTDNFKNIDFSKYKSKIKIINHQDNLGKGAAIKTGIRALDGLNVETKVILFDADDEIDVEALPKILEMYNNNSDCKIIYGSRYLNKTINEYFNYGILRFFANKFLTTFINLRLGLKLTDMETAVKSFEYSLIKDKNIKSDGFEIEPEITLILHSQNLKFYEIPIKYQPRSKAEGKKISFFDGIKTIRYIYTNAR